VRAAVPDRSVLRRDRVHAMTDPSAQLSTTPTDAGFAVHGEIDAHTAPSVAAAIEHDQRDELVIDLAAVEFVDSSGLRVLIEAHQRRADAGRSIAFVNLSPVVRRLFDIAGVDGYLEIRDPS
jgi:anti-sigma B factor antagonist